HALTEEPSFSDPSAQPELLVDAPHQPTEHTTAVDPELTPQEPSSPTEAATEEPLTSPSPAPTSTPAPRPLSETTLVYTCYTDGWNQICTMNADGSNQQRLTSGRAHSHYGSISPDGSTIAFSSYRSGQWEIHLMDLDGSNPRQLTRNHGQNHAPSISPDGSRIVFTSTAGSPKNDQNIWVMDIDGSNLRQLTFDRGGHSLDPEWSPDGQLISFASERDGARRLYVMRADGSDVRLLTPH